jgi:hypothetical protein
MLLFFSLYVVCAKAKLPLPHAAYRVAALIDQLMCLANCKAAQAACLLMRGAQDNICMAAECWPKFFRHSMTSSSICFLCFRCMFDLNVACALSGCVYVAMAIDPCCECMFQMFQLFQTYVASVLSGCCICCNGYTRML